MILGGVLGKKSNELERFQKNTKQKKILIGSIVGIIVLVGSIVLIRSYALYKEEKTFNVIRGKVPEFSSIDLELLSFTMDGSSIETAPSKGAYDVKVSCNNEAEGYWDYEEWGPQIKNLKKKTKCSIAFTTGKYMRDYIISLSESNESGVEKISHEAISQTPELIDYQYTGASPNNYVYFGCSDNCTDDNLYRIIGVIPTKNEYENMKIE